MVEDSVTAWRTVAAYLDLNTVRAGFARFRYRSFT